MVLSNSVLPGDRVSGDTHSGDGHSGDKDSGDRDSGDRDSGDVESEDSVVGDVLLWPDLRLARSSGFAYVSCMNKLTKIEPTTETTKVLKAKL